MEEELPLGMTGFRAVLSDGKVIHEVNGQPGRATNWGDIPLEKLSVLELVYRGRRVATLSLKDIRLQNPDDWYFSHTAHVDSSNWKSVVQYRNIGYWESGVLHMWRMHEATGVVHVEELEDCRR